MVCHHLGTRATECIVSAALLWSVRVDMKSASFIYWLLGTKRVFGLLIDIRFSVARQ